MLSLVLTARPAGSLKPVFCIPEGGAIAQLCGFSLARWPWPASGALSPRAHPLSGARSGTHSRSPQQRWGSVSLALRTFGVPFPSPLRTGSQFAVAFCIFWIQALWAFSCKFLNNLGAYPKPFTPQRESQNWAFLLIVSHHNLLSKFSNLLSLFLLVQ